ncbi:MAG: hypothetical protein GTO29_11325 [Candidatus Latescibacteria bacterium]|nr:hypothetical protein [Candidatus Latescibacterota bacterium]NIO56755.1 hypothetical protein [Candidatus Latescibacterota bacterium]NIT02340.1 hypothetical protein [Candidatus Latescibacterota bacterium]NIT39223.1 hypothetical protein [Candidatus Latescibacterota bacterium]
MSPTQRSEAERIRAIGETTGLSRMLRRALEPGHDFQPLPKPGPHDWLANHPEPGQTFEEFLRLKPNKPDAVRNKIYLQPLEKFQPGEAPSLEKLEQFAEAFFAMEVEVLPIGSLDSSNITSRANPHTGQTQLLTVDILAHLKLRLPDDAYCLLGITMRDLYPDPSWNFVFGEASLMDRVGVYSFARYDPRFYGEKALDAGKLVLRRSCKVLAHEMAHMFGIRHCVFFHCLMNGSNHLAESDARPLHLCPVDFRKLHDSVGFDIVDRYRRLKDFSEAVSFNDESKWLEKRIEHITAR